GSLPKGRRLRFMLWVPSSDWTLTYSEAYVRWLWEKTMFERIKNEPALLTGFITAVIALAVSFGAPISDDQKAAIVGVAVAVVALLGGVVTRQNVIPTRVLTFDDEPGDVLYGDDLYADESMFEDVDAAEDED